MPDKLALVVGLPLSFKHERALAGLSGLQFPQQFRAYFDRAEFVSAETAESEASNLRPLTDKYRWVILLGKPCAEAFHVDLLEKDYFRWGPLPADDPEALSRLPYSGVKPGTLSVGPSCVVVPDFVGDRKWWRSPKNCYKARFFWHSVADRIELEVIRAEDSFAPEVLA